VGKKAEKTSVLVQLPLERVLEIEIL
jgi:hypothetical protein